MVKISEVIEEKYDMKVLLELYLERSNIERWFGIFVVRNDEDNDIHCFYSPDTKDINPEKTVVKNLREAKKWLVGLGMIGLTEINGTALFNNIYN